MSRAVSPSRTLCLTLRDEAATTAFARALAPRLGPGDCLLLDGPIGAGKTHFARSLIRARLNTDEDVPSPTFTLVQTYGPEDDEIWHADLYRLSDTSEIEELGLAAAFDTAISLIEWPDRLGPLAPEDALSLTFTPGQPEHPEDDDAPRTLDLKWSAAKWDTKLKDLPA